MRMLLKLLVVGAALTLGGAAVSSGTAPRPRVEARPKLSTSPCPSGMKTIGCTALLLVEATLR